MDIYLSAAQEAIDRLGLLNSESDETISKILKNGHGLHPKKLSSDHRKSDPQLSKEEKRSLGLRSNAFMSQSAFAEISQKGLIDAIKAHETTLLRASFTIFRWKSIQSIEETKRIVGDCFAGVRFDANPDACSFCQNLDGTLLENPLDALFPDKSCTCITANYGISVKVDWLLGGSQKDNQYSHDSRPMMRGIFQRIIDRLNFGRNS